MQNFSEIQDRAKKLIDEGLKILKTGVKDAELIAGSTASAAGLHMEAGRSRLMMHRIFYELGRAVYKENKNLSYGSGLILSQGILDLIEKARALEETADDDDQKLDAFSVVKGEKPKIRHSRSPRQSYPCGCGAVRNSGKKNRLAAKKKSSRGRKNSKRAR